MEYEEISDLEAADDYRRQRFARLAQKNGIVAPARKTVEDWFSSNGEFLRKMASQSGQPEDDTDLLVAEFKQIYMTATEHPDFVDASGDHILRGLLKRVEAACSNIPTSAGGAVIGSAPQIGLDAAQVAVMGLDASYIAVSLPTIPFCNNVCKLLAYSMAHSVLDDETVKISNDPELMLQRIRRNKPLRQLWVRLVASFALLGWPPGKPYISTPGPLLITRMLLLDAMELFIVAHEFGHHVLKHGSVSSTEPPKAAFQQELDADYLARAVSYADAAGSEHQNIYAASGAGCVIALKANQLVALARQVCRTGSDELPTSASHPDYDARIEHLGIFDSLAPIEWVAPFRDLRECFQRIFELIWQEIRPDFVELHNGGARPIADL